MYKISNFFKKWAKCTQLTYVTFAYVAHFFSKYKVYIKHSTYCARLFIYINLKTVFRPSIHLKAI